MKTKCDIIVTYCWNRVGYNILRSLTSHGLSVWAADTSKKNICSRSKFCAGSFVYPDPFTEEDAFIQCLLTKVEELNPMVLLPTHDESVVIMRHRDKFPADLIIPYESEELLLTLANKAKATELASTAGVPTPRVYDGIDDVTKYPVVFKTVIGNSAKGVYFPKNQEELIKYMDNHKDEETLLEEWMGGTDYSVDCVRWDGFWKSSVYHALVTKTDGGGTTTQREIVSVPELENYARMLLDSVDYHGVCGLDFRYDSETGKAAFIEVNARFTGGLATPVAAGFDIPWIVWKLATEGKYDEPIEIKVGTKTKWILGDVITFVGRLLSFKFSWSEMKQVFKFRGFDAFDDYRKDDKGAILGEMSYYFEKLVKNRKLNP
jgi:predicted ATP-grasp superfamily ATP-dependent carboligase